MSETFEALERQFFLIKINASRLFAACETEDQRNELRQAYAQARDNYNRAMNQIFNDNDQAVATLRGQLNQQQKAIEDSLASLQNISAVINLITAGVNIGTKLIGVVTGP